MESERMYVFVVTCYGGEEEPTVTVFDNEENAQKCADYFKTEGKVAMDKAPVYKKFLIGSEVNKNET